MYLYPCAHPSNKKMSIEIPTRSIRTTSGLETENLANRLLSKFLKHFYSLLQRKPNKSGMSDVALPTQSLASLRKALQSCIIQETNREGDLVEKYTSSHQFSHKGTNALWRSSMWE